MLVGSNFEIFEDSSELPSVPIVSFFSNFESDLRNLWSICRIFGDFNLQRYRLCYSFVWNQQLFEFSWSWPVQGPTHVIFKMICRNPRTNRSNFLRRDAGIYGPVNRPELLMSYAGIYEPPDQSGFLKRYAGIHGPLNRSEFLKRDAGIHTFKIFFEIGDLIFHLYHFYFGWLIVTLSTYEFLSS